MRFTFADDKVVDAVQTMTSTPMIKNHRQNFRTNASVVKNPMLQNGGINAHRRLSRLFTSPSTYYDAQYVRHLVSPLYQNRRVLISAITINWVSQA